tara:strand:- start:1362 stop:2456 length:1095 start_codon:yes stop_codon:yes gene_type:complete
VLFFKTTQILKMDNNQQNFIDQLNASWNAQPQINKEEVSTAQGYQNNQNSETTYKGARLIFPNTSIDQIWKDNGLDFQAKPTKLFYQDHNKVLQEVTEYQGIINNSTGQLLNIPKNDYTILQLDKIKNVIESCRDSLAIESIMNIDSKRFVINTYIKECIGDVRKDDPIKRRCTFITSMDSSVGFTLALLDFRMFCFNQMAQVKSSENLSFKHTKSITALVDRLPRVIDFNKHTFKQSIEEYKYMVRKEIKEEQAHEILKDLFKNEWANKQVCTHRTLKTTRPKTVNDLVQYKPIMDNFRKENNIHKSSNAYNLHNAVTSYLCHEQGANNIKDESERARIRLENCLYKSSKATINRSKELLLAA